MANGKLLREKKLSGAEYQTINFADVGRFKGKSQ